MEDEAHAPSSGPRWEVEPRHRQITALPWETGARAVRARAERGSLISQMPRHQGAKAAGAFSAR